MSRKRGGDDRKIERGSLSVPGLLVRVGRRKGGLKEGTVKTVGGLQHALDYGQKRARTREVVQEVLKFKDVLLLFAGGGVLLSWKKALWRRYEE